MPFSPIWILAAVVVFCPSSPGGIQWRNAASGALFYEMRNHFPQNLQLIGILCRAETWSLIAHLCSEFSVNRREEVGRREKFAGPNSGSWRRCSQMHIDPSAHALGVEMVVSQRLKRVSQDCMRGGSGRTRDTVSIFAPYICMGRNDSFFSI